MAKKSENKETVFEAYVLGCFKKEVSGRIIFTPYFQNLNADCLTVFPSREKANAFLKANKARISHYDAKSDPIVFHVKFKFPKFKKEVTMADIRKQFGEDVIILKD